jgi:hypothetical protein
MWAGGAQEAAIATLTGVCERDWRFGALAAADRALADFPEVQHLVVEHAAFVRRGGHERRKELAEAFARA